MRTTIASSIATRKIAVAGLRAMRVSPLSVPTFIRKKGEAVQQLSLQLSTHNHARLLVRSLFLNGEDISHEGSSG